MTGLQMFQKYSHFFNRGEKTIVPVDFSINKKLMSVLRMFNIKQNITTKTGSYTKAKPYKKHLTLFTQKSLNVLAVCER